MEDGNWQVLRNQPIVAFWCGKHITLPTIGSYVVFPSTDRGDRQTNFHGEIPLYLVTALYNDPAYQKGLEDGWARVRAWNKAT